MAQSDPPAFRLHQLLRPLSQREVEALASSLNEWLGAQLQVVEVEPDLRSTAKALSLAKSGTMAKPGALRLGFYLHGQTRWVVIDYNRQAPALIVFPIDQSPRPLKKKQRRPLELFLRSHFVGKRLRAVGVRTDFSRAIDLFFDPSLDRSDEGRARRLEICLAPHDRNVLAEADGKTISEFKPQQDESAPDFKSTLDSFRTPLELFREWSGANQKESALLKAESASSDFDPIAPEVAKKRKALEKVRVEIQNKETNPARQVGEWIKTHQSLDVPKEWSGFIKPGESLAIAIERLFTEAKSIERKLAGTRARALQIEREISELESGVVKEKARDRLLEVADAKARKYDIAEDLTLYLGKSAKENIAILRKAQPFDLWLHLRERPGAHGILRRPRGRIVSDRELLLAGLRVAEQSLKKRASQMKGEVFDLLVAECRHVRPVKNHPGLVNYSNERTLRLKIS